jgi:hypothetical protein
MGVLEQGVTGHTRFLYSRDDRSYPGEHHLWLFVVRGKGVYDVFDVEQVPGVRRYYRVQNNATITWNGRSVSDFNPLIGGVWTHRAMERNFAKALKTKPVAIPLVEGGMRKPVCSSFGGQVR